MSFPRGAWFFFLLAGTHAFRGRTQGQTLQLNRSGRVRAEKLVGVSGAAQSFVRLACAKDPAARPRSTELTRSRWISQPRRDALANLRLLLPQAVDEPEESPRLPSVVDPVTPRGPVTPGSRGSASRTRRTGLSFGQLSVDVSFAKRGSGRLRSQETVVSSMSVGSSSSGASSYATGDYGVAY
mmetsp:Transcript_58890/g.157417  ORF Transcript_58890/g.157417 Transcript_58890/m.157417 type:complete len:183 (+) Transcript_58890:221-769(+)